MYRVLIVDDEEPVLDSFRFIFENYVEDFTLCGCGRTGKEAIHLVAEFEPHVVFMDIQMPGTDGIETIKILRPLYPHTLFILATAYERFDIAKKAIQLGVFSYLVKPLSKNKILEELKKVKVHLEDLQSSNKHQGEEFLENSRDEMQKGFLEGLIWKSPTEKEWREYQRLFALQSDRAVIYILGGLAHLQQEKRQEVYQAVFQKIQYKFICLSPDIGVRLMLFFPEERPLGELEPQIRRILKEFQTSNPLLGIGEIQLFSEFSLSFSQAYSPFSDNGDPSRNQNDLTQRIDLVRRMVKSQDSRGIELFREYWEDVFHGFSLTTALGKMVSLFTLLFQELEDSILINSRLNLDPAEKIMDFTSVQKWQSWSNQAIREFYNLLELQRNRSYPKPLKKALSYIAEFYDQQLQLSGVAEECSVSGSYLSRLFSEHMDITFIDYVNRYRVNQAVSLLKEKNISIKEAAYEVGYQDPNYFSRIFRKIMGFSPSDLEKGASL
ncbi:MAG: response regulator [Spirochaetaceae bacterium]|jgi:two-component system response regulator YesN|nr:response regulator [Spirochaetaceae bacterium]